MNPTYLTLPLFMTLILGFALQMENIAQESADKAIAFSDDMNNAMDCATRGIPISVCSPNLVEYDFSEDTKEYLIALEEMKTTLNNTIIINETTNEPILI